MLSAFGRKSLVAIGLFASLMASASAYGLGGGGGGGSLQFGIVIIAPLAVPAGNSIDGILTGGQAPMMASGRGQCGNLPGSPTGGYSDPVTFSFLTFEPMKGSVVTIFATDAGGSSDTACVAIL